MNPITLNTGEQLDPKVLKVVRTIRTLEGGNYEDRTGDSGSSAGAYQWNNNKKPLAPNELPARWKEHAQEVLGDSNAPMTRENQNKVAYGIVDKYKKQGLQPEEIDALWNGAKKDTATGRYTHISQDRANKFRQELAKNNSQQDNQNNTPIQQPQEQGGAPFKYNPTDNPFVSGLKTAGNLPHSGVEFAKGAVSTVNPVNTISNLSESAGIIGDLKEQQGGTFGALKAFAKEIPKATYETLVPQGVRNLISGLIGGGDLQSATKEFVEDPVGNVAPLVLGAEGLAKGMDTMATRSAVRETPTAKPVTKYSDAFNKGVENTAGLITKPIQGVLNKTGDVLKSGATYGISKFTGMDPQTINQILQNPAEFTKTAREETSRGGLANEVKDAIDTRISDLSETGKGYNGIKQSGEVASASFIKDGTGIRPLFLDDALKANGLEIKNGKISATTKSSTRNTSDLNALNKFYKDWGNQKTFTPEEFLNMRSDLADLAKYDKLTGMGKTSAIEKIAMDMRTKANEMIRPQFKGLKELDDQYSPEVQFLRQVKKDFVNPDGTLKDNAPSKIANSANKAELTKRLENIMPGITKRIEILKAVEDIERSSGIKVGTYGTNIPGLIGIMSNGVIGLIISQIIATPENAVRIIRSAGKLDSSVIKPIIQALRLLSGNINVTSGMIAEKSPITTGLINSNTKINNQ